MVSERGLRDPAEGLAPVVEPLLAVRGRLRERGDYALADAVRDALSAGGVEIKDTRQGSRWELARSP
jgi:cysteinyl-tRNA synthetase